MAVQVKFACRSIKKFNLKKKQSSLEKKTFADSCLA